MLAKKKAIVKMLDSQLFKRVTKTSMCSADKVIEIFELRPDISATDDAFLCSQHYKAVHKHINRHIKQLANLAGHRGETIKALANCNNFRRTHRFILESWEAFYMYKYEEFLKKSNNSE